MMARRPSTLRPLSLSSRNILPVLKHHGTAKLCTWPPESRFRLQFGRLGKVMPGLVGLMRLLINAPQVEMRGCAIGVHGDRLLKMVDGRIELARNNEQAAEVDEEFQARGYSDAFFVKLLGLSVAI